MLCGKNIYTFWHAYQVIRFLMKYNQLIIYMTKYKSFDLSNEFYFNNYLI